MSRPVYLQGRGRGRGRGGPSPGRGGPPPGYNGPPYHPTQHWGGGQQWSGPGVGGQPWGGPGGQPWAGGGPQWGNSHRPQLPPRLQQKGSNGDIGQQYHRGRWEQWTNHGGGQQRQTGQQQQQQQPAHHQPHHHQAAHQQQQPQQMQASSSGDSGDDSSVSTQDRFQDAVTEHQRNVQHHLNTQSTKYEYESSSDEEDLNDEDIMSQTLKSYHGTGTGVSDPGDLGRTKEHLVNSIKSKANACLICIETIKRNDPVWKCTTCYTMFHITCIQKWVKDGVYQQTATSDDDEVDAKSIPWHCPKCRNEYAQVECPTRYLCFCGKEEDPEFDPWLIPHSCGQTCGQQLKPTCGHQCLLLCHPGPCPPCPQTVLVSCHCGKQSPQIKRCGAKEWSCGQFCGQQLTCGHHRCRMPCHAGECLPCPETSLQSCLCQHSKSVRPCATPEWQCDKVCGSNLDCGQHVCEIKCHAGSCGSCPRAGKRLCPCGKSEFELPCTEDVLTCVDTCGKLLTCGLHTCSQKCHNGECGTCRQMTMKKCKCGQRQKELPCFKEYICDVRCPKMKDCHRHPCKRKCCDGSCTPCDKQCGKSLSCRNHKCTSRCHRGPCYPCPLTVTLTCFCKTTSLTVPCGRERVTKPPKCAEKCQNPPDCHHSTALPHRCHFGLCPPCRQVCGKSMPDCDHTCPVKCHSAVRVTVPEKMAVPWDPKPQCRIEVVEKPCMPCSYPMKVSCLGEHETVSMPCSSARVASCRRPCGRLLLCTNHTCQLDCHVVHNPAADQLAGSNCGVCEETCQQLRPEGCTHMCVRPCHPGECEDCMQMLRMPCHCKAIMKYVECYKWTAADREDKEVLKACPGRCPKTLDCGHQCCKTCHQGPCTNVSGCTERVRLACTCRRRKKDYPCNEVCVNNLKVQCDEICRQNKKRKQKEAEIAAAAAREEELKQQQAEVEEFERKMRGRKRKPRKQHIEEDTPGFLRRHSKLLVATVLVALFSIFMYYLINSD